MSAIAFIILAIGGIGAWLIYDGKLLVDKQAERDIEEFVRRSSAPLDPATTVALGVEAESEQLKATHSDKNKDFMYTQNHTAKLIADMKLNIGKGASKE